MQAADAGVSVISGLRAVTAHNFVEPADERPEVFRVHRRVLNKGQGLGVPANAHQQAQSALPHVPNVGLSGTVQQVHAGVAQATALQVRLQAVHLGSEFGLGFAVELHRQDRARVAFYERHAGRVTHGLAGPVQQNFVHHFYGRRIVPENLTGGLAGLDDAGEVDHGKAGHGRPGHQVDLGLGNHAESALRTDHHLGQVEGGIGKKFVQVIPADPAHDFGVPGLDFSRVVLGNTTQPPVDVGFQVRATELGFQLAGFQPFEMDPRSIGKDHLQFLDVVQGLSVDDRVSAAGVVAETAADTGPV